MPPFVRATSTRLLRPWLPRLLAVASHLLGPPAVDDGRHDGDGRSPVTFFLWNAHATGGTVRTVLRQAGALADRGRRVTVVAVLCHRYQHELAFDLHPDVHLEVLVPRSRLADLHGPRAWLLRWLDRRPALLSHPSTGRETQASCLTDLLLLGRVARTGGIVVGTRAGLGLALARFARSEATVVAQEHLLLRRYTPQVRKALRRHLAHVALVTCLTEADAQAYRRLWRDGGPRVEVIPNAVPDLLPEPADPDATRIVSVGRLAVAKHLERLIAAFARIAPDRPGWDLEVVGEGPQRAELEAQVTELGLDDRVRFVGETRDVAGHLAAASVFGLSSSFESFGLVVLEAWAAGLAVVSTDCPAGPRELIEDGRTGLLAPVGDVDALADQLRRVTGDPVLRRHLAAAGRRAVGDYRVSAVTDRWEQLFDEVTRRHEPPTLVGAGTGSDPWRTSGTG